jgi:hypothetical protein
MKQDKTKGITKAELESAISELPKGNPLPTTRLFRGHSLPVWFKNTETIDELAELLDNNINVTEGVKNPTYGAEAVEKMVRARAIQFRRENPSIPPLPESRYLQDWQDWFTNIKRPDETPEDKGEPPNLFAVNIIPQYFKITTRTIYRWIDSKRLKSYPDDDGLIRVDAVEIAKYAKRIQGK